jgi:hypothetical protein
MDERSTPRGLEEWVTFARDVLDLHDGEAEAYGIARQVEDENRAVPSARRTTGGHEAPPAHAPLDA